MLHFVNRCRAEALARVVIFLGTSGRTDLGVEYVQVCWLVFVMSDGTVINVGDLVERKLLVELQL
jgi:hypothetical protein